MSPTPPSGAPRVAYLTSEYPAVSHTFILREVEALRRLGLEVETASIRRTGAEHHRGPSEKHAAKTTFYILDEAKKLVPLIAAKLHALRDPGRFFDTLAQAWSMRNPGLKSALYQMFYFAEALILARWLKDRGITHLHNHFAASSATVSMLAARLAGIPFSFTLHGPADLTNTGYWRLGDKIAGAAFVACISHYARSQAMLVSAPDDWERLRIIHCGVLPAMYERPETAPEKAPGTHLVFVGRLAPVKGLRVLIEALAELDRSDIRLTIVGDGTERKALEAMAAPLDERVNFTGYQSQDEVAAILATADAFVLPSFAEGVPVVLMEALAAGLTVIATRITGVPELVDHGVSGLLVPPGDPEALSDVIAGFADDPEAAQTMGAAGRETVRSEFDIDIEAARLARLFTDGPGEVLRPEPLEP
ncbi:MAG: glycosyltransferase family 4 protein [Pseudomonadota bacterium]